VNSLERGYRRLLRWYPPEHRRAHEEEILGVLLASGDPDRHRPSARDAFDLVRGGLRIRFRRAPEGFVRAGWRDAAALLNVLAPLVLLLAAVRYAVAAGSMYPQVRHLLFPGGGWVVASFHAAPSWLLWAVAASAALAGARRIAAGGVLAAIVVELATLTAYTDYADGTVVTPIVLGLITLAALRFGPGAARGREVLGRRGLTIITVLIAGAAAFGSATIRALLNMPWIGMPLILAVAAAAVAAWLARTAAGRRAAIVLTVPLYPVVAPILPVSSEDALLVTVVGVPVALCVAGLAVTVVLERLARS
jgi:hypothetical protein